MIHKDKNQGDLSKPALCSSKRVLTAQISGVVVDVVDHETQILKLYVVSSYLSSVDIYLWFIFIDNYRCQIMDQ